MTGSTLLDSAQCCPLLTLPRLWGLVNNAGISTPTAPNEWLTKQDFMKILDVNLLGVIDVTLRCCPWCGKGKGRVVNVSSVSRPGALLVEAIACPSMV